jgi:O-antigen/teichoic acid export membrane protein
VPARGRRINKPVSDQVTDSMGTLARGITVNMIGSGYNVTSRMLFNVLIARILGPRQVGVYYLALTVAYLAGVMAVGGLDTTVIRFLSRYRVDNNWGAFRGTLRFALRAVGALGVLGSTFLLAGAPWIATRIFQKPELIVPLRIVALYVPLFAFEAVMLAATQSFKQMKYKVYIEAMLNPTLRIVLAVTVYLLGGRVYAVLGAYIFSVLICAFLSVLALRRCIPVDLTAYQPTVYRRELVNYWSPMFGVHVLNFTVLYADTLILAHYRSSTEVGLYSVCFRLIVVQGFFLGVISQIFGPMISELHHRSELKQLADYSKAVTLWAVEVFAPIALVFLVAPREIMGIFGGGFRSAAPCLLILVIGQIANYVTGPVGLIINMAGWSRLQLFNTSVSLALQVALAFLLVPSWGILGAAVANSAALVTLNLVQLLAVRRRLGFHPFSMALAKPFLAVLASLMVAGLLSHHPLLSGTRQAALVCAGMFVAYSGTLFSLGLDKHSRIAWDQFRYLILPRLLSRPAGVLLGR